MKIMLTLCRNKECCPSVEVNNGMFIIKDDFGGRVNLTRDQLKLLIENYPKLQEEN